MSESTKRIVVDSDISDDSARETQKRTTLEVVAKAGASGVGALAGGLLLGAGLEGAVAGGIAGTMLSEAVALFAKTPIARRLETWSSDVNDKLRLLEERQDGFDRDSVLEDPAFITALLQASSSAIRTHQKEKREALRNAVLNVAAGTNLDDDRTSLFLRYIDELTPSHIEILAFAIRPAAWFEAHGHQWRSYLPHGVHHFRRDALMPIRSDEDVYPLWVNDLVSRGLLTRDPIFEIENIWNQTAFTASRASRLGNAFYAFLQLPQSLQDSKNDR